MSKTAVVFWSATGNTEAMADAVKEGAAQAGAEVSVFSASDFSADKAAEFDSIAFGCPAMGDEVLEEDEFQPMFDSVLPALKDKKIGLFGSYGWGDGQWMRDWEDRCRAAGAVLTGDGVMANNAPGEDALEACRDLGSSLASSRRRGCCSLQGTRRSFGVTLLPEYGTPGLPKGIVAVQRFADPIPISLLFCMNVCFCRRFCIVILIDFCSLTKRVF